MNINFLQNYERNRCTFPNRTNKIKLTCGFWYCDKSERSFRRLQLRTNDLRFSDCETFVDPICNSEPAAISQTS